MTIRGAMTLPRRTLWLLAVIIVVVCLAFGILRGHGISAVGHRPMPFEAHVAKAGWRLLVPSAVRSAPNPVPADDATLKAAREHWADHCAICHDNDGSGDTSLGRRVYPPVPDLRAPETQRLTDGELFYAIEHGVPWTAMPGWTTGTSDGERDSWALVRFVRHLPAVTPAELRQMERLNPKPSPSEEREKEIDDFLKGSSSSAAGRR